MFGITDELGEEPYLKNHVGIRSSEASVGHESSCGGDLN